jgi:hypothetical protein
LQAAAALAVVGAPKAGTIAPADVELAVGAEGQIAHGVTGVLLAPVLDQDLLVAGHRVRGNISLQAREALADHATIGGRSWRGGTGVRGRTRRAPARRGFVDRRVLGVQYIHVGPGREARVEGKAKQAAVPLVVYLRAQAGEDLWLFVREVVEDFDQATLFGDEDPSVLGELYVSRLVQPTKDDGLIEAGRERRLGTRCR